MTFNDWAQKYRSRIDDCIADARKSHASRLLEIHPFSLCAFPDGSTVPVIPPVIVSARVAPVTWESAEKLFVDGYYDLAVPQVRALIEAADAETLRRPEIKLFLRKIEPMIFAMESVARRTAREREDALAVTTTHGERFSSDDHADLAWLVYRRFGRDLATATCAWNRLMEGNCTMSQFIALVDLSHLNDERTKGCP